MSEKVSHYGYCPDTLILLQPCIRRIDTLSREITLSKLFWLLSEKGFTLKGKNLLPLGANSFLLKYTPFQKGLGAQESNQGVRKVVSPL